MRMQMYLFHSYHATKYALFYAIFAKLKKRNSETPWAIGQCLLFLLKFPQALWDPSQYGGFFVALQVHKYAVPVSAAAKRKFGEPLLSLCAPSQNGWSPLWPQVHQEYYLPSFNSQGMGASPPRLLLYSIIIRDILFLNDKYLSVSVWAPF